MTHRISIAREQYKFSCAHMTVFADGTKERLHGHNYTVAIEIDCCSPPVTIMSRSSCVTGPDVPTWMGLGESRLTGRRMPKPVAWSPRRKATCLP